MLTTTTMEKEKKITYLPICWWCSLTISRSTHSVDIDIHIAFLISEIVHAVVESDEVEDDEEEEEEFFADFEPVAKNAKSNNICSKPEPKCVRAEYEWMAFAHSNKYIECYRKSVSSAVSARAHQQTIECDEHIKRNKTMNDDKADKTKQSEKKKTKKLSKKKYEFVFDGTVNSAVKWRPFRQTASRSIQYFIATTKINCC